MTLGSQVLLFVIASVGLLLTGWRVLPRLKQLTYDRIRFIYRCRALVRRCSHNGSSCALHNERIQLWAHAGFGDGFKYMNSREAIACAIALGYDAVEIDVGVTRDGMPVLTHDFKPNNERLFDTVPDSKEFLSTTLWGGQHSLTLDALLSEHADDQVVFSVDTCHFDGGGARFG